MNAVEEVTENIVGAFYVKKEGYTEHTFYEGEIGEHINNKKFYINNDKLDQFHSMITHSWRMSNADKVKQFTEESMGLDCPLVPRPMDKTEVAFLIKMLTSELVELAQTVCENNDEAMEMVRSSVSVDLNSNYVKPQNEVELMAQQADAPVDLWYYSLNAFAKVGINLSKIFDVVHQANMDKKWPDGKFHRRPDGKVIKPEDWKEPDINAEIVKQIKNGW